MLCCIVETSRLSLLHFHGGVMAYLEWLRARVGPRKVVKMDNAL